MIIYTFIFSNRRLGEDPIVHFKKIFRASFITLLAALQLIALLLPAPALSLDSDDSQLFISGFNAYQRKDYNSAIKQMTTLLQKYPHTPLKDVTIFWLATSYYETGNEQE